jgi:hypothetical protein
MFTSAAAISARCSKGRESISAVHLHLRGDYVPGAVKVKPEGTRGSSLHYEYDTAII